METAAILIIGNEILSGRTQDKNISFIGMRCSEIGIRLKEVRIIEDNELEIIENVKKLSEKFDHVFTTGGIGPTHDDITAEAIAKACKQKLELNKTAHKLLKEHYSKTEYSLNESRLKMAYIPTNSKLIKNSVSAAPGFKIDNIWVMAGVPKIMQAMFLEDVEPHIKNDNPIISLSIKVEKPEGEIAKILKKLQNKFTEIDIGSYPYFQPPFLSTTVILRSSNKKHLENAIKVLSQNLSDANIQYLLEE